MASKATLGVALLTCLVPALGGNATAQFDIVERGRALVSGNVRRMSLDRQNRRKPSCRRAGIS